MGRNYFSKEQIEELRKSEYVKKISEANVQFTDSFKNEFMELLNGGSSPMEALNKLNVNPKTLGTQRVSALACRMREHAIRPEGFNRRENSSKGKKRKLIFNTEQDELAYYKEYALRLKQELDFTKKIEALERRYSVKQSKVKNTK